MYLSICRSIDLLIYLSIYRSIYLPVCLSIFPSIHLFIYQSIHPSLSKSRAGKCYIPRMWEKHRWNSGGEPPDLVKDALANCRCHDDKDLRKDGKACKASMQQLEQQFRNRKQVAEPVAGSASKPGPVRQPQPPNPPSSREIPKPSPLQQSNLSSPRSSSEIQSCPLS